MGTTSCAGCLPIRPCRSEPAEPAINYYPFHIGDYASATRHLSWDEDCAYRRLLDAYYTAEKPLPAEERAVCRLVLATTETQREAVMTVLSEFWTLTDAGWINTRADAEIAAMREKQQKQRDKANKRWDKQRTEHGTAPAMPQHESDDAAASKNDADAMPPTPTPTPTPKKNPSGSSARTRAAKRVPDDFVVTPELQAWAQANAPGLDWRAETEKFRDWEFQAARTDWPACWRTWMRKAQERAGGPTGTGAAWWLSAGFADRYEAENAGCKAGNAHLFRDGKRHLEAA